MDDDVSVAFVTVCVAFSSVRFHIPREYSNSLYIYSGKHCYDIDLPNYWAFFWSEKGQMTMIQGYRWSLGYALRWFTAADSLRQRKALSFFCMATAGSWNSYVVYSMLLQLMILMMTDADSLMYVACRTVFQSFRYRDVKTRILLVLCVYYGDADWKNVVQDTRKFRFSNRVKRQSHGVEIGV